MAFTFRGTYTKNRGDLAAAGTVDIINKSSGATLDTATLDENGSYELVLDEQEGEMTVVETMEGVAVRSYSVGVSRGSITDTSRDIGYVGPGAAGGGSDLPTPGAGDAGKLVVVTAEEDGFELQQIGAYEPEGAVATHSADTTSVHGIADTADVVIGDGITDIVALTQAAYDLLTPDATTLYVIVEA